jgi:hypothetical protein
MTTLNQELYEALVAAGAPNDLAKRAAASVSSVSSQLLSELATQAELKDAIVHLDTRLAIIETRFTHVEAALKRVKRLLWALVLGVILLLARAYLGGF